MKPKLIPVLEEAIEAGVNIGYARAYKHDDDPTPDKLKATIAAYVMSEICQRFHIEDE